MPKPSDISSEIIGRFRAFLADRGHAPAWSDNVLRLALKIVARYSPDQPREANGRFGSGGGLLAPDKGDGTGAAGTNGGAKNGKSNGNGGRKNGNGPKQIGKEDAARDFSKEKGASKQDFHAQVGDKVRELLRGMGFPVKPPLPPAETGSVYLKSKEFNVRISDGHDAQPKKQSTPPVKPEYQLVIPAGSSSVSAAKVNKLLSEIVAKHKKIKK